MNLWQSVIEALESIQANKMRSGLTMLGIVIGVGAVIAMLAVGNGAQNTITGSISDIGTNLIFIYSGNQEEEVRNPKPLTLTDVDALNDKFMAPSIDSAAPLLSGQGEISFAGESTTSSINGITPDYMDVRNYELMDGEFISDQHLLGRSSVAVIGVDIADKLFGYRNGLLGETIRIEGQPFRIIGLLEPKGGSMMGSEDNLVMVPFTTAQSRLLRRNSNDVDMIIVKALDSELVSSAEEEIKTTIRERHRITLGPDDFTIFSQQSMVDTARQITGVFTIFLGGIAGISLLVGGIGIMNIMLVSVTERTREIGLRKALGARKRDILMQFLTESAILSLVGGLIGIALGWLLSFIISQIAAAAGSPLNAAVGLDAILLATIFSAAVGVFFGLYPANRAASLVPVEALRFE